jgi:hypothetical protein
VFLYPPQVLLGLACEGDEIGILCSMIVTEEKFVGNFNEKTRRKEITWNI